MLGSAASSSGTYSRATLIGTKRGNPENQATHSSTKRRKLDSNSGAFDQIANVPSMKQQPSAGKIQPGKPNAKAHSSTLSHYQSSDHSPPADAHGNGRKNRHRPKNVGDKGGGYRSCLKSANAGAASGHTPRKPGVRFVAAAIENLSEDTAPKEVEGTLKEAKPKDRGCFGHACSFGRVSTTPGSVIKDSFEIVQRVTTYGRANDNIFRFPKHEDKRVPRHAFDISFWRPGIERDIQKDMHFDLTKELNLVAIVSTRSRHPILIYGVELIKGENSWQYGKLYTGDIITVFDSSSDEQAGSGFLKFECSFYIGRSRYPRAQHDPFTILIEKKKFDRYIRRKKRRKFNRNKIEAANAALVKEDAATSAVNFMSGPAASP